MDHNDIRHKLSEYIDGSVTAEERSSIEAHLKNCTACTDALHELQKTVEHIKSVPEVEPPAWMTQKIMANVRSEAEEKKGLLQRLFLPLSVKLPIQAVAVLFLAVTAFYLYQNMQPAAKYAEAPPEKFEGVKPAAPLLSPTPEPKLRREPAAPAGKAPQTPEYKALDMKQEYERPAPPVLADKMAPAPAKRAEPSEGLSADRRAETAVPAPKAKALAIGEEPKKIPLSLTAPDVSHAARDVEKIILQLNGRIVEKTEDANSSVLKLALDSGRMKELVTKLRTVGELKEKDMPLSEHHGILIIVIAIHKSSAAP